ncbi:MAG: hypothetical protein J6P03_02260 [Opitutales bacterium]|nr:hypothetical protein [Opitutales bacterium]
MRKELENILFDHLKTSLSAELKTMLVRGHSTDDRHIPYISIDVGEIKPFGDMLESDGIFEAEVNVAIADSAHDIDYKYLFPRISEVRAILGTFALENDKYRCEGLWFESETDARDDNNLGVVLTYKLVFQRL